MKKCEAFSCDDKALDATYFCSKHFWRLSKDDQEALSRARGIHLSTSDPLVKEMTSVQLNNAIANCKDALRSGERRIA